MLTVAIVMNHNSRFNVHFCYAITIFSTCLIFYIHCYILFRQHDIYYEVELVAYIVSSYVFQDQ